MTEHTYPDRHLPGSHWALDVAWEILDTLPPGRLDPVERAYLCGLMTAALEQCAEHGPIEPTGRLPKFKP